MWFGNRFHKSGLVPDAFKVGHMLLEVFSIQSCMFSILNNAETVIVFLYSLLTNKSCSIL